MQQNLKNGTNWHGLTLSHKLTHLTLTKNENKEIAMEFYKYMYWKCKTVHKESLEQIQYQQHSQDVRK